jgi:hypothetical protein
MTVQRIRVKLQPGFQEAFVRTPADIAIGGGAAGAGKSYALLYEPAVRYQHIPTFRSVFFRRTYPEITNPGGLRDTSNGLYPLFGAKLSQMDWNFPSKAKIVFRHLQRESDIYSWQGAQIPDIRFDELTHFTATQFFYMMSRNRNPNNDGIVSRIRASCNPDPDSFVAELIEWFIDQEEKLPDGSPNGRYGFPIPERCGQLRYFARKNNEYIWGATAKEVIAKAPELYTGETANTRPKSITFIPGDIYGNKALLRSDPNYLAGLMALPEEDQQKLLFGNWKIRADGLALYNPSAVGSIFTNYPPAGDQMYITADVARFGHDWTVILVWRGWEVIECVVMKENDSPEAVNVIEGLREKHHIMAHHVLVDQNGVGGAVLDLRPDYVGFLNNASAMEDPAIQVKENYKNLKTQCFYRSAERVNRGALKVTLNDDTVTVYESSPSKSGGFNHVINRGCRTKMGGKVVDIREVIKQQLRAIRKEKPDFEGKKQINTKEAQKILLSGWSPDFADCVMMREYFELAPKPLDFGGWDMS